MPSPYDWVAICIPTTASGAVLGTAQRFPDVGGQHDGALVGRKVFKPRGTLITCPAPDMGSVAWDQIE